MQLFFGQITENELKEYFLCNSKNYQQTIEMAALKSARNYDIYYVGVKNVENQLLFAALLTGIKIRVGYVFEIAGLPLHDTDDVIETFLIGLKKFVKDNQGVSLTISPDVTHKIISDDGQERIQNTDMLAFLQEYGFEHEGFSHGFSKGNPNWMYVKDLTDLTETTIQDSYTKQARYSIKKAKEFGVQVRKLSYDELPIFKQITQVTSDRREFEDKSLEYYQTVFKTHQDHAKFLVAEINLHDYCTSLHNKKQELEEKIRILDEKLAENPKSRKRTNQRREIIAEINTFENRIDEGQHWLAEEPEATVPLACALFLFNSQETVYLFSGTKERYKKMYAPFLIQDEMIKFSVGKQIPQYNFYGIQGIFDGSDSILKFKQSFNGYAVEKLGSFTCVLAPAKLKFYHFLKRVTGR